MTKIIILLVVAAAAVSSINADGNFPNFPQFGLFPFNGFGFPQQAFAPLALLDPKNVKDMKPGPGGHVSGAFVSSSSSSETIDGVTKEKNSGRVVTNQDGKVHDVSY